ncbi:RNA-binding protein [archaeon]|nr:RNA-binding protein [archaeon]
MRKIVLPGEKIDSKVRDFAYPSAGSSYSAVVGLYDDKEGLARLIPLSGRYDPIIDDFVIGFVVDPKYGGARVDIKSPYTAYLPTPRPLNFGDVVTAVVKDVDEVKSVILWRDRKVPSGGVIIEVEAVKVPRVIGKRNSMVDMLKQLSGCEILVGKNGRIWIKGSDEAVAKVTKAILKIESEAHTAGLTERIKELLSK